MRFIAPFLLALAFVPHAIAQEAIKADKVAEVKTGSVFIRNQTGTKTSSGSGFVVGMAGDSILVATNAHVVTSAENENLAPARMLAKLKEVKLKILFDSGTAAERSANGEVLSLDPVTDVAIVKVKSAEVRNPPKPLKIAGSKALAETTTVYTFGFPFGDKLSTGKGPAITVSKASISSLRTNEAGRLSMIQIDGSLNPGNSGGPVVDAEGSVIGIATATVRESQGIGLVVPAAEVEAMLAGKVGALRAEYLKQTDGKVKVLIEALVSDPFAKLSGVTLKYVHADVHAAKPKASADLAKLPGARSIALKVEGPVAKCELLLDNSEGQLFYNAQVDAPKKAADPGPVTAVALPRAVLAKQGNGADDKAPEGWKEISLEDKFVTVWVPEKSSKQVNRDIAYNSPGGIITGKTATTTGDNGCTYRLERIHVTIIRGVAKQPDPQVLAEVIAKLIAEESKGRIKEVTDAKIWHFACKEYTIVSAGKTEVVRIAAIPRTIYVVRVSGTAKAVAGDDGQLFLNSFCIHPDRMPEATIAPTPIAPTPVTPAPVVPMPVVPTPVVPQPIAPPTKPRTSPIVEAKILPSGETEMVSGGVDTPFREYGPEGSQLVGFESRMGKLLNRDAVTGLKPIYRTKSGETSGTAYGKGSDPKTVKAKAGYAVGAVNVQRGLFIEGYSLVFMKIAGDKLDPADSYESEWTGDASKRTDLRLDGNGLPFIGFLPKVHTRTNELTGFALILNTPDAIAARKMWTTGTSTDVLGGGNHHPVYRDLAPEGGQLIGLEVGIATQGNHQVVRGIRPIYLVGDKESMGKQFGTQFQKTVTLKADPGYAIGAVSLITFGAAEGLSVTFMKVGKTGLDPKSTYESEWVGFTDMRSKPQKLTGLGKTVIGITGRQTPRENTGFGLILQDGKK